jgi:hypothetical protein
MAPSKMGLLIVALSKIQAIRPCARRIRPHHTAR